MANQGHYAFLWASGRLSVGSCSGVALVIAKSLRDARRLLRAEDPHAADLLKNVEPLRLGRDQAIVLWGGDF